MHFLLSGEGPSDLGSVDFAGKLKKGPMAWLLESLVLQQCPQAQLDYDMLDEHELQKQTKERARNFLGRGKSKVDKIFSGLFKNARCLAEIAKQKGTDWMVVFFRDSDETHSAPRDRWDKLVKAIEAGFQASRYDRGIPMVPRPKSEAWLLGYYQKGLLNGVAYQNCQRFEEMPGNDDSPNSLKKLLQKALKTTGNAYDKINEEEIRNIDWSKVDMTSLKRFRQRLTVVLNQR